MRFQEKLNIAVKKNNSLLSVAIDPKEPSFEWCKNIIDQTFELVCSFKFNSAFFEAGGAGGIKELEKTFEYLQKRYPQIPTILDAKRADIGNSNNGYAKYAFEFLGADSITLNPYLGEETVAPFLDRKDKGCIILCRTSNEGAKEFQDLQVSGRALYQIVAENVVKKWNKNKNCLLVVGATYPEELRSIREIAGDMTLLVPGIGAQGGDLKKTIQVGLNSKKEGLIITVARAIIFAENPRKEAMKYASEINKHRR